MLHSDATPSRKRGKIRTSEDYQVDQSESIPRRIVSFALWAAQRMPRRAIPVPVFAKAVLILPKTPTEDSKHCETIRNALGRARRIMMKEHKRGMPFVPGSGLRATVDSKDLAQTTHEHNARRAVKSFETLDESRAAIKLNEIDDPAVRARVMAISSACKALTQADVIAKLTLPAKKREG